MAEKDKNLALFFTYGVSLELWQKKGMLERELKLYKRLGEHFNKIYFVTYGRNDNKFGSQLKEYNIEVLPKKFWLPNFIYFLLIPYFYKKELKDCDYYKTNQMLGSCVAVKAKKKFKKPLIIRTGYTLSIFAKKKSWLRYLIAGFIEKHNLKHADVFVVATEEEKEYFKKYSPKVIPNYVDIDLFEPKSDLKNKKAETKLLFIGRLSKQKNLENLILAVNDLTKVKLQIIGSGELENKLKGMAKDNVEFLGNQPHEKLPNYINQADIFILPSWYEGNPKTLLEAMACGALIISTDVSGINNILRHKENAYIVKTDKMSLKTGIAEVTKEITAYNHLGKQARKEVEEKYSLDKIIELELENYLI